MSSSYPRFCFSPSSLSLPMQRPRVVCRVLPDLTPRGCDANEPRQSGKPAHLSPSHASCSPSASAVAWPSSLLTMPVCSYHTLSPLTTKHQRCSLAGLLSVAVLRPRSLSRSGPPLAVSRGSLPYKANTVYRPRWARSREVPLELFAPATESSDTRPLPWY